MQRLFSLDGTLYRVLTLLFDLICLNLCLILTSLPIVTIGPALTATYSVTLKLVNNQSSHVWSDYWQAFRTNFKQSTLVFLINGALLGGLVWCLKSAPIELLRFPLLLLLALLLLCNELIFPLSLLSWENLRQHYAASFGLTLKYLIYVVISFVITLITVLVPIFLFKLFLVWLVLGMGLAFYLKTKLLNPIFIALQLIDIPEEE